MPNISFSFVLYLLPLMARLALSWPANAPSAWGDVALSVLPLLVVFPTLAFPRIFGDDLETEHVARHVAFALAFTVSIGASVRWEAIEAGLRDASTDWAVPLVTFLGAGCITLWWFCLSHHWENRVARSEVRTHQGDVAVLPLTLVAIATFAERVPDEAFRWSRCVVFFVPVVVGWATLHFIAYNGFATGRITTHTMPGFYHMSLSGLVIASAFLFLIETRAPPLLFQLFPWVAAFLCQLTPTMGRAVPLRTNRLVGVSALSIAFGVAIGTALRARFPTLPLAIASVPAVGLVVSALTIPPLAGRFWPWASAPYSTLLSTSLLRLRVDFFGVVDALALLAAYWASAHVVEVLASSVEDFPEGPTGLKFPLAHDPSARDRTPQERNSLLTSPSKWLQRCASDQDPSERSALLIRDAHSLAAKRVHPSCPPEFRGVWYMKNNPFPMTLLAVHHGRWSEDGKTTRLRTGACLAYEHTFAGFLLKAAMSLNVTNVSVEDGRWIRTRKTELPPLHLRPDTYWLYRVSENEMLRLAYDRAGRVVFQYRLFRVLWIDERGTPHKTPFHRLMEPPH